MVTASKVFMLSYYDRGSLTVEMPFASPDAAYRRLNERRAERRAAGLPLPTHPEIKKVKPVGSGRGERPRRGRNAL